MRSISNWLIFLWGVEDIIDGGGGGGDIVYLPGSSSDYSSQQIGEAVANKYRIYDGSTNPIATIENVESLQFDDRQVNPDDLRELVSLSIAENSSTDSIIYFPETTSIGSLPLTSLLLG